MAPEIRKISDRGARRGSIKGKCEKTQGNYSVTCLLTKDIIKVNHFTFPTKKRHEACDNNGVQKTEASLAVPRQTNQYLQESEDLFSAS